VAYGSGETITASDYNVLVKNIKEVYNDSPSVERIDDSYGYGRTLPELNEVEPDKIIENSEWYDLFLIIRRIATHQGTTLDDEIPEQIAKGDIIEAYGTLTQAVEKVRGNRLTVSSTTTYDIKPLGTSTRTTEWDEQIVHQFMLKFANKSEARYFFNTGGKITIYGEREGGSDTGINNAWTQTLKDVDNIIINHSSTSSSSGQVAVDIGFYTLTLSDQKIAQKSVGVEDLPDISNSLGYYASDIYIVDAKRSNDWTELYFTVYFRSEDDDKLVDGTLTSTVSAWTVTSLRHPSDPELPDLQPIILPTYEKIKGIDESQEPIP